MSKVIFLTSLIGGYKKSADGTKIATKVDNSNGFIHRLKQAKSKINNFVFVASDPDDYSKTDEYSSLIIKALNLDGFDIKNINVIDHRFTSNLKQTVMLADAVFLSGGNVPTQNKFFKEISLKSILKEYKGIIIGQSAGSMNCSKTVYVQPEEDEEFEDKNFKKTTKGLGLVDFCIMPHMNSANEIDDKKHPTVMQMCLEDSYLIPHYGICDYGFIEVQNKKVVSYGKTILIKNGKCIELCKNGECVELRNDYRIECKKL